MLTIHSWVWLEMDLNGVNWSPQTKIKNFSPISKALPPIVPWSWPWKAAQVYQHCPWVIQPNFTPCSRFSGGSRDFIHFHAFSLNFHAIPEMTEVGALELAGITSSFPTDFHFTTLGPGPQNVWMAQTAQVHCLPTLSYDINWSSTKTTSLGPSSLTGSACAMPRGPRNVAEFHWVQPGPSRWKYVKISSLLDLAKEIDRKTFKQTLQNSWDACVYFAFLLHITHTVITMTVSVFITKRYHAHKRPP